MTIAQCRNCKTAELEGVLDLGSQPPSNGFTDPKKPRTWEKTYPLALLFCRHCHLLQLSETVDPHEMFTDYVYTSSTSRPLREHLQALSRNLVEAFPSSPKDLAVDIGCNDGALLSGYPSGEIRILGIEPSSVAEMARAKGLPVHRAFFSAETAARVVKDHGQARFVTATNVFAHVADQDDFLQGLETLLHPEGIFVIEVPYLVDMLEQNLFDTIYHEHIFYFGLLALENLLERRGLRVFHVERFSFGPSGPPIRVFICRRDGLYPTRPSVEKMRECERALDLTLPAPYKTFAARVSGVQKKLLRLLEELKGRGESLIGYGAPAKGNTILNTFGIDGRWLDAVVEKSRLKVGLLTPGTRIPVVDEESFDLKPYRYALLLSWNLLNEFLEKSDFIRGGGKFIVPLPEPRIVPS